MRVLICGDRWWTDRNLIRKAIRQLPRTAIIVHGAARGADSLARQVAEAEDYEAEPHPAKWHRYGRAAGPIRNKEMLDSGINMVIAFHDNLENSKGTKDMVEQAKRAGVPVHIVHH